VKRALAAAALVLALAALLAPAAAAKPVPAGPAGQDPAAAAGSAGTDWAGIAVGGAFAAVAIGGGVWCAARRPRTRRVPGQGHAGTALAARR
jgi:hypothetical protein